MTSRKKKALAISSVLAALLLVSATYAWFTSQDSATNRLATSDSPAGAQIVEVFNDVDDWKPGQEVAKQVAVVNTSEAPIFARLSFAEVLALATVVDPLPDSVYADDPALMPATMNTGAFTAANGWYPVTTTPDDDNLGGLFLTDAAPADLTVLAKMTTVNEGDANERTSYGFVYFATIPSGDYAGESQRVEVESTFDPAGPELTLDEVGYVVYGTSPFDADWAAAAAPYTQPSKDDVFAAVTEMMAADEPVDGIEGGYIQLIYDAINNDTPTADKWFYNEDDGWFYYIGRIESGESSNNLLNSLMLDERADSAYANLVFDLTVNMSAIQTTLDAVTGAWELDPDHPVVLALTPYCD